MDIKLQSWLQHLQKKGKPTKQRKKKENKKQQKWTKKNRKTHIFSFYEVLYIKVLHFFSSKMNKDLVSCVFASYLSAADDWSFLCLPEAVGRGTWEPPIGFCNGFRAANISANVGLAFGSLQYKKSSI